MNYLLDTHTLIWALLEKERLSARVKQILENPENNVIVSAITFWEISLKFSIGKLELKGIQSHEFPGLALQAGFELISLSPGEAASYDNLIKTSHRDPFDRMLIWQAIGRNFILITKDESIMQYKDFGLKIVW